MQFFVAGVLLLLCAAQLASARTLSKNVDSNKRELLENLRSAILAKDKREAEAKEAAHELDARGAWEDFKASVKKAGQKVKNAFGKKEESRQFADLGDLSGTVSANERRAYKVEIETWRELVDAFGVQNEPEIKEMSAAFDEIWAALDLDNV